VQIILAARAGYRIPEPTRLADQYVNALRRRELPTDEPSAAPPRWVHLRLIPRTIRSPE
jgi:hypothetical protein